MRDEGGGKRSVEEDERTEDKGAEGIDAKARGGVPPPSPSPLTSQSIFKHSSASPPDWLGVAMVTDAAPSVAMPPLATTPPSFSLPSSNSITQSHYATQLGETHTRSEV